eukprot:2512529-Pleurochrysis_carterae.AAC.3
MGRAEIMRATPMYVKTPELSSCQRSGVSANARGMSIAVLKIGTEDNVADVFTKWLSPNVRHKHVNMACGVCKSKQHLL